MCQLICHSFWLSRFYCILVPVEIRTYVRCRYLKTRCSSWSRGFCFWPIHLLVSQCLWGTSLSLLLVWSKEAKQTAMTTVPGGMRRPALTGNEIKKPLELHFNITQPYHAGNSHQGKPSVTLWGFWEAAVLLHAVNWTCSTKGIRLQTTAERGFCLFWI